MDPKEPERQRSKFDTPQMRRMVAVGEVGPSFARIWMRSDSPGEMKVIVHPQGQPQQPQEERVDIQAEDATDLTQTALIQGLEPLCRYSYKVVRSEDDALIGSGGFETFPKTPEDTPDKYSVALMSCHQPFNEDNFRVEERRMRLLRVVPKILTDNDVKFILLAGDQIYADAPRRRSLFYKHYTKRWHDPAGSRITDWDAPTVRRAYQERYRIFWSMEEVQHFYANYPCYPIMDDHETCDDWGAKKSHSKKRFRNVRKGARDAYFDYQGSRVMERKQHLPPSLHYSFNYGDMGIFVMDIRSQRKGGSAGQLFGAAQFKNFKTFLGKNRDKRVLLVMVSVPVVHLPEWLSDLGAGLFGHHADFPDHWSYKKNRDARDRILGLLYHHQVENPTQRVILVSGDVHLGCAFAIRWQGRGKQPTLYQFTSSAISNLMQKSTTSFLELAPRTAGKIVCAGGLKAKTPLLDSRDPERCGENPFGGLNIGIIEVHKEESESPVTLKLVGYPQGGHNEHVDFFVSKKL